MFRTAGLIVVALLTVRLLADQVVTVDVQGAAEIIRSTGDSILGRDGEMEERRQIPYNPSTGRVNQGGR